MKQQKRLSVRDFRIHAPARSAKSADLLASLTSNTVKLTLEI